MLDEDAAMNLVSKLIPDYSEAQRAAALRENFSTTSPSSASLPVQDNSVIVAKDSDNFGWENFLVYRELQRAGKLNLRITEWLPFEVDLARLQQMRRDGGTTDPWLKTGSLKEVLDGSLGARTAAMLAPYSDDPNATGIMRIPSDKLKAFAIERDRDGFQVAFHAIGSLQQSHRPRYFRRRHRRQWPTRPPRSRRTRPNRRARRFRPIRQHEYHRLGVHKPAHLLTDQRWATGRIGPRRILGAYAWRSMERAGVHLAFGTDFPVEAINPLRGIYSCVTRELPQGGPGHGWRPEEKLNMHDCLSDYTVGSAYAEFEEKTKGKIAVGMLADFVVFPEDLNKIPPQQLLTLPVTMTIAGGLIVYQNPNAPSPP